MKKFIVILFGLLLGLCTLQEEVIKTVPTGDNSNAILYLILATAILIYGAIIIIYKRKKN